MSEFRRLCADVEELEALQPQLVGMELAVQYQHVGEVGPRLEDLTGKLEKYQKKAAEKDPDKKMYGDAMVLKIKGIGERFEAVREALEPWMESVVADYAPVQAMEEAQRVEMERKRLEAEAVAQREREAAEQRRKEAEQAAQRERERQEEELRDAMRRQAEQVAREEKERNDEEMDRRRRLAEYLEHNDPSDILRDGVRELQASCPKAKLPMTLQAILGIVENVANNPEEEMFKKVRRTNDQFHADVGQYGGEACLHAVGFREVYATVGSEGWMTVEWLEMVEPDVQENYEEWVEWLDTVNSVKNTLKEVLEALARGRYQQRPVNLEEILATERGLF